MSDFTELDRIKHELEERFPGWQIWYVPHYSGHALRPAVKWCARPHPLLDSASPERLAAEIEAAEASAEAGWPALAAVAP